MVEPQTLCRIAELLGKRPYVSALLTEGAQDLKLEDALVEGAGQCGGWWRAVQALPPLGPLHGGFVLSGIGDGKRTRTQLLEVKGLFIYNNKNKQTKTTP